MPGRIQHLEISWIAWLWSLVEEDIMVRSSAKPLTLWGVERAMRELVGLWLGDQYHLSFPFAGSNGSLSG